MFLWLSVTTASTFNINVMFDFVNLFMMWDNLVLFIVHTHVDKSVYVSRC
jgi:hypothetical protein